MEISYRLTTCAIALVLGAFIFLLVRRNQLHVSYSIWWLSAGLFAVLSGLFPTAFDALGHALGVNYPPVLFIVLVLAAFAVRMLVSDIERTRMELTQRRLVQRYAILALRLRDVERQLKAHGGELSKPVPPDLPGDLPGAPSDDEPPPPARG